MNQRSISRLILGALILFSCVRESVAVGREGEITITAGFENFADSEAATKTYVASGTQIRWSSGAVDKVLFVFDSKGGKNIFTSSATSPSVSREFSGTVTEGSEPTLILWSGKSAADDKSELQEVAASDAVGNENIKEGSSISFETKSSGGKRTVLTGESLCVVNPQNINNNNSFAPDANIAVMRPGDKTLRSVFGYIRFTIPAGEDGSATIKSVTFTADEPLAGQVRVDCSAAEPTAAIVANGSKSLTVNTRYQTKDGGYYEPGTVYAVLPEGSYHNLTMTVTPFEGSAKAKDAATGEPYTRTSKGPVVIKRGCYTDAGEIKPKPSADEVITKITKIQSGTVSALCIEGSYLYAGSKGQITVYDISNPKSPVQAGSVIFPGSVRQMVPYNGKLFVSARETGVWIFSIANPSAPSVVSRYDGIELSTGIDAAGDAIFVGERQTGVEFVDGRSPANPEHIRVIKTNESQSVFYHQGYVYSGEWGAGKVTIFNAKDLSNIQMLKQIDLQGFGDGLWVQDNRLYASTGHHHRNQTPSTVNGDGHGVEIWDVSDPENPKFISRTEFDIFYLSGSDWWMNRPAGDGKTLFCGDVYNGMYVVDITDEYHPEILYRWKPGSGHAVNSIALADGVAFVSVSSEGLYAMECSRAKPTRRDRGVSPTNLNARYSYDTPASSHFNAWVPDQRGAVKGAVVYGDALFVACGDAGLYTVKLDSSNKPYTYRRLDIPFAGGVALRGNLLFVSRGYEGLGVYRIGNDHQLSQVELIKTGLNPTSPSDQFSYWVSVPNDNYVVNGVRSSGYQFLSIGGTDAAPTFTFRRQYSLNLNYNRYISEKACPNGWLPYATRSGLVWINLGVADKVDAPTVYDGIKNALTEGCTLYKDGKVLLAQHVSGSYPTQSYFGLIDPAGSAVYQESNRSTAGFEGIPRWESGDDVLVCNFVQRFVSKINTANFSNCTLTFREETLGYPEPGLFWNGKCIVPCGYQGLLIEK